MVKTHIIKKLKDLFDKVYQTKVVENGNLCIFNTVHQCTVSVFDGSIQWFSLGAGLFQFKISLSNPEAINIAIKDITQLLKSCHSP